MCNCRYSNVIPLPETRVHLQRQNDDEKTEYINANYVKVSVLEIKNVKRDVNSLKCSSLGSSGFK